MSAAERAHAQAVQGAAEHRAETGGWWLRPSRDTAPLAATLEADPRFRPESESCTVRPPSGCPPYLCTRGIGHAGRHIATDTSRILAAWPGTHEPTLADLDDPQPATAEIRCCDLHNQHCEPPSELCCGSCSEADHPKHPDGVPCVVASAAQHSAVTTPAVQETPEQYGARAFAENWADEQLTYPATARPSAALGYAVMRIEARYDHAPADLAAAVIAAAVIAAVTAQRVASAEGSIYLASADDVPPNAGSAT